MKPPKIETLTAQLKKEVDGLAKKTPKTDAGKADLRYAVEDWRLAVQKCVEALKEVETGLNEHFIAHLPKSQASGVAGQTARVQLRTKIIPQVQDWNALYKHIKKSGEFELLQRRLTDSAIKERWEARQDVPGVGHFTAIVVSCTKL